mgnify:CR=1 FL=1
MGRLAGKVAVVTGGASGIGEGVVDRFVAEGARVVVADLRNARDADRHGDATVFARTDVTVEADVAAAVDLAVADFGRLDIMVNNAGTIGSLGSIVRLSEQAYDDTVGVLLKGVFLGIKHAARVMIPQGSGAIVSTASTAGFVGGLGPHLYTAAKHGVVGLTRSVANELGSHGIRVNSVAPGGTVTAMTATIHGGDPDDGSVVAERLAAGSLLGTAILPADVADAVLYLAGDEARCVTGQTLVVDVGQTTSGTATHRFNTGDPDSHRDAGRSS